MQLPPNTLRRQELLDTSDGDIPDAVRVELAQMCGGVPQVRAVYAARVRQTVGGGGAREGLHIAYELRVSPTSAEEARTSRETMIALIRAMPRELSQTGITLLSEAALPAWRRWGVRIFARSSS